MKSRFFFYSFQWRKNFFINFCEFSFGRFAALCIFTLLSSKLECCALAYYSLISRLNITSILRRRISLNLIRFQAIYSACLTLKLIIIIWMLWLGLSSWHFLNSRLWQQFSLICSIWFMLTANPDSSFCTFSWIIIWSSFLIFSGTNALSFS